MRKSKLIQKLIKKFNAKSKSHLLIIFLVFALSGSVSLWISSPIMTALDLKNILNNHLLFIFFRVLIIIPVYQIVLIVIATFLVNFNIFGDLKKKF